MGSSHGIFALSLYRFNSACAPISVFDSLANDSDSVWLTRKVSTLYNEAHFLKMLYFEDFMEAIECLPSEVSENLTNMTDLELQAQKILEPLRAMITTFFEDCNLSKLSKAGMEAQHEAILKEYDEALSYSKKKTAIVRNLYETYKQVVRKLDSELSKFRLELEADNSGVTSKIEHRIHTLLGRSSSGANRLEKRRTKLRTGHLFANNIVISRRRQRFTSESSERKHFLLKRRVSNLDNSPLHLPSLTPYYGSTPSCISGDITNPLITDDQSRLDNPDSINRIQSSESLDSMNEDIENDFEVFDTVQQENYVHADQLHLTIASNKRSRILRKSGTLTEVHGRTPQRSNQAYGSESSPFISSDNEAMGMTNLSNNTYSYAEESVDDLLNESRPINDFISDSFPSKSYTSEKTHPYSPDSPSSQHHGTFNAQKLSIKRNTFPSNYASESPQHGWIASSANLNEDLGHSKIDSRPLLTNASVGRGKRKIKAGRKHYRLNSLLEKVDDKSSEPDSVMVSAAYSPDVHYKQLDDAIPSENGNAPGDDFRKIFYPTSSARITELRKELPLSDTYEQDEDRQRYCFCQDVSYGDMIACDAPSCQFEWFHYSCVGLTVAPKGQWFCPSCEKLGISSKFPRKRLTKR